MSDLLIQNCCVLHIADSGSRAEIVGDQDILVRGNTIEAVQPTAIANKRHFRTWIDAQGMLCGGD